MREAAGDGRNVASVPQQTGRAGDAVRAGSMSRAEILMILDAGLTVPPEDLVVLPRARVRRL
jgi:hypothetical protein